MTAQNTGGPAFPLDQVEAFAYASAVEDLANPKLDPAERVHLQAKCSALSGMTLRDYFAAQALTGFLHNAEHHQIVDMPKVARGAYAIADAMLKAREA